MDRADKKTVDEVKTTDVVEEPMVDEVNTTDEVEEPMVDKEKITDAVEEPAADEAKATDAVEEPAADEVEAVIFDLCILYFLPHSSNLIELSFILKYIAEKCRSCCNLLYHTYGRS